MLLIILIIILIIITWGGFTSWKFFPKIYENFIMDSNKQLVNYLRNKSLIKHDKVYNVFNQIDRGNYVDRFPYKDSPISIGYGATISAPHMHAIMCELLYEKFTDTEGEYKILDVGSGSGYLTAIFAKLYPNSKVIGVEHIPELCKISKNNTKNIENMKIIESDGKLGYKKESPYDMIHVGASADKIPDELVNQLNSGGRMIIPIGNMLKQIDKDKKIIEKDIMGVVFVPLI